VAADAPLPVRVRAAVVEVAVSRTPEAIAVHLTAEDRNVMLVSPRAARSSRPLFVFSLFLSESERHSDRDADGGTGRGMDTFCSCRIRVARQSGREVVLRLPVMLVVEVVDGDIEVNTGPEGRALEVPTRWC
jgi:hypothetical protein